MKRKHTVKRIVIRSLVILAAVFVIIEFTISILVTHSMLDNKVTYSTIWSAEDFDLPTPDTLHLTASDGLALTAYAVSPLSPKAVIICLTGINKPSVTCYWGHAKMFYDAGYASVLLDVRGHGLSDGNRICAGYQETRDVQAVTDYLDASSQFAGVSIIAMGISMGAGIAINSAAVNQDIDAIVSISSYSSLEDMFAEFMSAQAPAPLTACIKPFVQITSLCKYGVNPWKVRPVHAIRSLGSRPILLMHTKQDSNVSFANFERIMKNAPEQAQTMVRDVDEHFFIKTFTDPQVDSVYCTALMNFIGKVAG